MIDKAAAIKKKHLFRRTYHKSITYEPGLTHLGARESLAADKPKNCESRKNHREFRRDQVSHCLSKVTVSLVWILPPTRVLVPQEGVNQPELSYYQTAWIGWCQQVGTGCAPAAVLFILRSNVDGPCTHPENMFLPAIEDTGFENAQSSAHD